MSGPRKSGDRVDGVLVLDKPRGPTSHDAVARVRRALGTREVGHAGTLDPMATGVLVVCVGEATKLSPWLTAADKTYEATIAFGAETDTLDAEGTVTRRADVPLALLEAFERVRSGTVHDHLARAVASERSRTMQVPPTVSAIKKDGVRSYVRARSAEGVDAEALAPRPVTLHALDLLDGGIDPDGHGGWLAVKCHVSKGFYVRALARDLAATLGTLGHLTALRRTRSGPFETDEAVPLDTPGDELAARLIPLARAAIRALPEARLTESGVRDARFGRAVRAEDIAWSGGGESGPCAWLDGEGGLVAVGERSEDGTGRVIRGFPVA
ncbi:MAG: tRNA pseudouridine(55) synthase TruB [Polyangiaceae bacterium]|jgi:tRNA pseudouridine55 synthase